MKKFLSFISLCLFILNANAQVPNGTFESWVNDSTPSSWTTSLNAGITTLYFGHKATGASGYGLQINSKLITVIATQYKAPGIATLGAISVNTSNMTANTTGGIPFIARPNQLNGVYKYVPDATDLMVAMVMLTKYNTALSKTDTIGIGTFSSPLLVSTFTPFTATINYTSALDPDTMNITLLSSNPLAAQANGVLVVDNLTLTGGNVGVDELSVDLIQSIQPNPSNGQFTVILNNMKKGMLKVYNSLGMEVYSNPEYLNGSAVDLGITKPGMYLVSIQNGNKQFVKKMMIY